MKIVYSLLLLSLLALSCAGPEIASERQEWQVSDSVKSGGQVESMYLTVTPRLPEATSTVEARATPDIRTFRVSFYCDGDRTALGIPTSRGIAAAAYSRDTYEPVIPFGSKIDLEGIGTVTILDTCPACEDNWLDVYVPSREEALNKGVKIVSGTIQQPPSGLQIER